MQFAGLDLLPEPVALYDARGSVLFANCASISAPLPRSLSKASFLLGQKSPLPSSPPVELLGAPLHSWTEQAAAAVGRCAVCGGQCGGQRVDRTGAGRVRVFTLQCHSFVVTPASSRHATQGWRG